MKGQTLLCEKVASYYVRHAFSCGSDGESDFGATMALPLDPWQPHTVSVSISIEFKLNLNQRGKPIVCTKMAQNLPVVCCESGGEIGVSGRRGVETATARLLRTWFWAFEQSSFSLLLLLLFFAFLDLSSFPIWFVWVVKWLATKTEWYFMHVENTWNFSPMNSYAQARTHAGTAIESRRGRDEITFESCGSGSTFSISLGY